MFPSSPILSFFLKGFLIGFSIAAPVGPIGVLCMRRTLAEGRIYGFLSGLGAATADAVYGSIAGFGLTFLSTLMIDQQAWLRLIGGVFLCYLGIRTFVARPSDREASARGHGLAGAYASTFLLTLTNPMTLLSFAALFAGLGVGSTQGNPLFAGILVLGIFLGSALWWLLLSIGVGLFRRKIHAQGVRWINRMSGGMIVVFGLLALLRGRG